ncbi:alpha/beta fold hydrolase [Saccharopolyspora sp. TS4A08]|uniref:Alpha/beta fold hydrolase n=1 Tax=Saccharopolyspora ipomoeae TaxID=3042027 RepID=A0ABT6PTN7_9PSEU|nr:alpha/beta fold hydrolase [Saccharopolyspora sp. TS4A08]MDI2031367.1 alpha/beta fold hydrolase [Saccharopolyspora sp. TS4A08]
MNQANQSNQLNTIEDDVTTAWIRRYRPSATSTARLVCFPHAGGSASFFHPLAPRFAPDTDVVSLQYPGRQDRRKEPFVEDIESLADLLADEIAALSDKPTVFFGHSMGAALAFETAHRLEQRGTRAPRSVIASGRRGPATVRDEEVHKRDDEGVIAELKKLNGTDMAIFGDEELLRMALPAIRNDYRAIESYRCEESKALRAPIVVLTGDQDPKTTRAEAEAWEKHTEGAFRLREFTGGHFFLTEHQVEVNREIETELAAARRAGEHG